MFENIINKVGPQVTCN